MKKSADNNYWPSKIYLSSQTQPSRAAASNNCAMITHDEMTLKILQESARAVAVGFILLFGARGQFRRFV